MTVWKESYIPGARGCLVLDLLKVSSCSRWFFLATVACRGQALGFSEAPRDGGYCNRGYINKDELGSQRRNQSSASSAHHCCLVDTRV